MESATLSFDPSQMSSFLSKMGSLSRNPEFSCSQHSFLKNKSFHLQCWTGNKKSKALLQSLLILVQLDKTCFLLQNVHTFEGIIA